MKSSEKFAHQLVTHETSCQKATLSEQKVSPKDDDDQKMAIMRKAFQMFDTTKSGFIETIKIATILNTMGQLFDEAELQALTAAEDHENTNKVNFDGFCNIASHFLEEEDDEAMQQSVTVADT